MPLWQTWLRGPTIKAGVRLESELWCHAELVSASTLDPTPNVRSPALPWTLKQVQGDGGAVHQQRLYFLGFTSVSPSAKRGGSVQTPFG
jgi:hypothetical protein